ncbi:hypothetical protein [Alteribacter populi]|uniref:hypothetical protein n=1 Tax=Alteribacter populi TaxID=2011011 RepID=UPI000BBB0936|nr:hypothetical protein [Alteribacter populi]
MTKKPRWNEKDIENTLKNLPPVKDRQSKDELFSKIETRAAEHSFSRSKSRRSKTWIYPVIASAAAIFLLILIVPSFLTNENQQSLTLDSTEDRDQSNDESNDESTIFFSEDDHDSEADSGSEEESISGDEQEEAAQPKADQEAAEQDSDEVEVAEIEEENGEEVQETDFVNIPVAYLYATTDRTIAAVKGEVVEADHQLSELLLEKLTSNDDDGQLTLEGLKNISFIDSETVQLDFAESETAHYQSFSSNETNGYKAGIEELFATLGYERILLTTDEEPGFMFGAEGNVNSWEIREGKEIRGYLLFETDNGENLIVHSSQTIDEAVSSSFEETLNMMREFDGGEDSPFLSPFSFIEDNNETVIDEVTEEEGGVVITFDEQFLLDEHSVEQKQMLEAIIHTAAEFHYDYILFEGAGAEQVMNISIGYPIAPYKISNVQN